MFLSRALSVAGLACALAGPPVARVPADGVDLVPADGVDLVPALTSTPFGAVAGQAVTHTVVVTGTGAGTASGVRVTFSTTVGLDGAAASTTQGRCSVADTFTVVCDLGVVTVPTSDNAPPTMTVTGTVAPGTVRGTLVQNRVEVAAEPRDSDVSNNAATNAYLVPGGSGAPANRSGADSSAGGGPPRPAYLVPVAGGVLVLGMLAAVIVTRRRRRIR